MIVRQKVIAALIVVAVTAGTAQATADADNCPFPGKHGSYHRATYIVRHTNLAGEVAWQINLKGESCVRWGKITAVRWNKWAYVNPNLRNWWEWIAWTDTVTGGGIGFSHAYRRVHAALKLCLLVDLGVTCPKRAYPFVAVTMTNSFPWSNGSVSRGM